MFSSVSSLAFNFWNVVVGLFSFIPKLMYLITTSFFSILDIFQLLFRKLAGLDTYYITTGGQTSQQTGDIVEEFINGIFTNKYPILSNIFWSFVILGVVMLFITTLVALIRNEYTPEKDGSNSKSKVVGRSLKAFLSFAIVPVVVIFGVYLCNVLLRALDAITSGSSTDALGMPTTNLAQYSRSEDSGGDSYIAYSLFGVKIATNTTPFSGVAFKASAYRANRARNVPEFMELLNAGSITNWNGTFSGTDAETVATYIDNAFANNVRFKNASTLDYSSDYQGTLNISALDIVSGVDVGLAGTVAFQTLDRYRVGVVWYYYDLWQFDFLVAWAIVISMLTVFINIIFGLMRRFFEVIGLFLVSPPVVALMPLDDGAAFGKWKGKFISKMLGAYGAVVGMNLMFVILPYIYNIKFFNIGIVDTIIQSIFIIVGLVTVKSFIALMSEVAGGDDVNKAGSEIAKEVGSTVQKAGAATLKVAGMALKVGGVTSIAGVGLSAGAAGLSTGLAALRARRQGGAGGGAGTPPAGGTPGAPGGGGGAPAPAGGAGGTTSGSTAPGGATSAGGATGSGTGGALPPASGGAGGSAGTPPAGGTPSAPGGGGGTPAPSGGSSGVAAGGSAPTGGAPSGGAGGGGSAPSGGAAPAGGRPRNGFLRRWGRNAVSGLTALGGMGGLFMDLVKGTDFYKGWDEAGGGDGLMIYARGGNASDVKAYRAAKDHYKARAAAAAVEGAGEFLRDPNGNLIPERNADGTVRRELRPRLDASGNPVRDAYGEVIMDPTGPVIYQRGNRNPNAGTWDIR